MSNVALRMLLWFLGQCIARGSRFMPSLRSQITRTLTFELSAGERVARHWVFDEIVPPDRLISRAVERASYLAARPTETIGAIKRAVNVAG